jgi:hypothetical protein
LRIKTCIIFAVAALFLSSALVMHVQAAEFEFREDFNYTDLDQMATAGWTLNRPAGTSLDSGAVILDGTGGDTSIVYKNHFPAGIYDWEAEARGMWLGQGAGTLCVAVITEHHSYSWSGDGYYNEFIFYRDSIVETRFSGYADELDEWFTFSMEREGDTLYFYFNEELEYTYTEEDTRPSQATGINLISPWIGDAKYDYYEFEGPETTPDTDEPVRESEPLLAAAAVGATVTAATALAALGPAFNSAISSLPVPKQLVSFLKFYGASLFQKVDKVKLEALKTLAFITKAELAYVGISVSIITVVYSFVAANGFPAFLEPSILAIVIPSTFFSSCIVVITKVFSGIFCAKTCGIYRKFSLWKTGVLMFIVSGLLFLFPFSSPGVTRYQSGEISKQTKALIVLSKTLILLTLAIPFTVLFLLGFRTVGDSGLMLTLMSAFFSLVPLKFLSGKAVFDYRKNLSLLALVSTGVLFFSYAFNVLPTPTYLVLGVASAAMATIALKQLKQSHKT